MSSNTTLAGWDNLASEVESLQSTEVGDPWCYGLPDITVLIVQPVGPLQLSMV